MAKKPRTDHPNYVEAMLASPDSELLISQGSWYAEEKYDGIRVCVSVAADGGDLFGNSSVHAWSRNGIDRLLPPHILALLEKFPSGIYDGELHVPGKRSYGAAALENASGLVLTLFDVLDVAGKRVLSLPYTDRRRLLHEVVAQRGGISVNSAWAEPVKTDEDIQRLAKTVWARDGEGLIVKRADSLYLPGKRSKSWIKFKQLRSAVMTVIGYRAGKLGPHSVLVLRDSEGVMTTVKVKNDHWWAEVEARHQEFLGRELRIEFQERTPDGGYRHPRWDRWETE